MSIRKVTSTLSDQNYVRALEKELSETAASLNSLQTRVNAIDIRPRVVSASALTVAPGTSDPVDIDTVYPDVDDPAARVTPAEPIAFSMDSNAYFGPTGVLNAAVTATYFPVTFSVSGDLIDILRHELYGRFAEEGGVWMQLTSTSGTSGSIDYKPLPPGEDWQFKVRAVSRTGVSGPFTPPIQIQLSADTTPPPTPSTPTLSSRLGVVTVAWDGKGSGGDAQPVDFDRCDVYMGGTVVGSITLSSGDNSCLVTGLDYNTEYEFWLIAVDTSGNASSPSLHATITVQPLVDTDLIGQIIDGAHIQPGTIDAADKVIANSITGAQIAALTIEAGNLDANSITADKIAAGSITGDKIVADTIQTSKLLIGDFTNLLDDPGFLADGTLGSAWGTIGGAARIDTVTAADHNREFRITSPGSTGELTASNSQRVTVQPGDRFYCEITKRVGTASVSSGFYVVAVLADGSATFPGSHYDNTNGTVSAVVTMPANAVQAYYSLTMRGPSAAADATIFYNPVFRRMTEGSLIVDGAIDGKTITGALVRTAASGARTELTNQGIHVLDGSGAELVKLGYGIATGMSIQNPRSGAQVPLANAAFGTRINVATSTQSTTILANVNNRAYARFASDTNALTFSAWSSTVLLEWGGHWGFTTGSYGAQQPRVYMRPLLNNVPVVAGTNGAVAAWEYGDEFNWQADVAGTFALAVTPGTTYTITTQWTFVTGQMSASSTAFLTNRYIAITPGD